MLVSNCCGAAVYPETDLCSVCREHCEVVNEEDEGGDKIMVVWTDGEPGGMVIQDEMERSVTTGSRNKQVGGGHYKSYKIQPIDYIVANNIPYREANVIKYVSRHNTKNGAEDIQKAIHYLEMILEEYNNSGK